MSSDPYASAEPPPPPPPPLDAPATSTTGTATPAQSAVHRTRAAALWTALTLGFLVLIVLLIFIAQNTESTEFQFLGWQWSLPLGVAILFAAVAGGLLTVAVGAVRIFQLRRAAKKNLKGGV
ncbi:lipopolysaccharide assembly protein LapA domain-containing protein [Mycolicibacterium rufum]|uniref:DUF1049 domain-containing protein n=1 Tax=Mycolicibacterium rufum TaxID=318424 RepID=A0A9X2YB19_9MYCO|nr:lipopolysaccharide assembly protein LapA domain-containing protein [Mycolicibacterium rufum]KGI70232.1 membrane protein [Mycolicibacterium rufum]MCV7070159.1 DUF1049 domain-containing protein [Mycolicibacterium rufum]ULP36515.1 lipopolysaccharide assembly protein LapA domain-containing protein [Mycolicibacterium rufum]